MCDLKMVQKNVKDIADQAQNCERLDVLKVDDVPTPIKKPTNHSTLCRARTAKI